MAILVTGAAGLVGRAAVRALLAQGVEHVRAVVREPWQAAPLRRLGAKVAVFDASDADTLELALAGVFTAVGLAGGLWTGQGHDPVGAVLGPCRALVRAAGRAGVRRLVVLSPAAADPRNDNAYLAASGQAEELVAASGLEHVVLRSTHVLGASGPLVERLRAAEPVRVPGSGAQRVAPVHVGDVARAIAVADERAAVSGVWSLAGPDEMAFDELVDLVRGRPAARLRSGAGPFTPTQLDYLARDSVVDAPSWAEFGLRPVAVASDLAAAPGGPLPSGPGR